MRSRKTPAKPLAVSNPALAVKILARQTAWLEGDLYWKDGRIAWKLKDEILVPDAAQLSRTQRRLYKIKGFPHVAKHLFADSGAWLKRRLAQLDLAKRFNAMSAASAPAHHSSRKASKTKVAQPTVEQLADLMIAEALCINTSDEPAATALLETGSQSHKALAAIITDCDLPTAARSFAAMVMGAGQSRTAEPLVRSTNEGWILRSWRYGQKHGLRPGASTYNLFLETKEGEKLCRQISDLLSKPSPFSLNLTQCRKLLLQKKLAPAAIAEILKSLADISPLQDYINTISSPSEWQPQPEAPSEPIKLFHNWIQHCSSLKTSPPYDPQVFAILRRVLTAAITGHLAPHDFLNDSRPQGTSELQPLPDKARQQAERFFKRLNTTRASFLERLTRLIKDYVMSTGEPASVSLIDSYVRKTISWDELSRAQLEVMIETLMAGLQLEGSLQPAYLEILITAHEKLWPAPLAPAARDRPPWYEKWDLIPYLIWHNELSAIARLLALGVDRETVGDIASRDLAHIISLSLLEDNISGEMILAALQIARRAQLNEHESIDRLIQALVQFPDAETARTTLKPIIDKAPQLPENRRDSIFFQLVWQTEVPGVSRSEAIRLIDPWILELGKEGEKSFCCNCGISELVHSQLVFSGSGKPPQWRDWFCRFIVENWQARNMCNHPLQPRAIAAVMTSLTDDFAVFKANVRTWLSFRETASAEVLESAARRLKNFPELRRSLSLAFADRPAPCLAVLKKMEVASKFSSANIEAVLTFQSADSLPANGAWAKLLSLVGEETEFIKAMYRDCLLTGTERLPRLLADIIEQRERSGAELEYLESHFASPAPSQKLSKRISSLKARLNEPGKLEASMRRQLRAALPKAGAIQHVEATNHILDEQIKESLSKLSGTLTQKDITAYFLDAAYLCFGLTTNKRVLKKLLKELVSGNKQWIRNHQSNQKFLKELSAKGADLDVWLGSFACKLTLKELPGQRLHIFLEQDPLTVLQMGNYFDTCLSLDSFNAFSTVSNACDLNKRVVYVLDGAERVIARKLIAITRDFKLVGFHTYTNLKEQAADRALQSAINKYCLEFARACRLEPANEGEVQRLVSEDWYDDGTLNWDSAPEASAARVCTSCSSRTYRRRRREKRQ